MAKQTTLKEVEKSAAKKSKTAKTRAKESEVRRFAVEFGGVSFGDTTARLGLTIDRGLMQIDQADKLLCGRRITGRIACIPAGTDPDQKELFESGENHEISGTFDCKRFGASPKQIGAGLVFSINDDELAALPHFAKRSGVLEIASVETVEDDEQSDTVDASEEER